MLLAQVQTDIRFVEVSRTKLKEASTSIFGTRGNFLFGSPRTLPTVGGIVRPSLPVNNDMFNLSFATGKTLLMINALEGSGFAYTLARPSLVALSGQSASFLAGGEVPIPVPSAGSEQRVHRVQGIRYSPDPDPHRHRQESHRTEGGTGSQ